MITKVTQQNFTGAPSRSIRVARGFVGNSFEQKPFLFNDVMKIVEKEKLPASIKTDSIDLHSVPQRILDKLMELKISFSIIG